MSKSELVKLNFIKGDSLIRAHNSSNSLSGTFDNYESSTDIFTFLPSGSERLKSEHLSDIKAIIKLDA